MGTQVSLVWVLAMVTSARQLVLGWVMVLVWGLRLVKNWELGRALVVRGENQDLERARELFESCGAPATIANSES